MYTKNSKHMDPTDLKIEEKSKFENSRLTKPILKPRV